VHPHGEVNMPAEQKPERNSGLPFELAGKINQTIKNKLIDSLVDGFGTMFMSDELVGRIIDELRLPREWLSTILSKTEKTRRGVADVLKNELRRFLEGLDLQQELTKLLSSMVLEVKTEIRFVPTKEGGLRQKRKARLFLRRSSDHAGQ
jgi:hypothetical protein